MRFFLFILVIITVTGGISILIAVFLKEVVKVIPSYVY